MNGDGFSFGAHSSFRINIRTFGERTVFSSSSVGSGFGLRFCWSFSFLRVAEKSISKRFVTLPSEAPFHQSHRRNCRRVDMDSRNLKRSRHTSEGRVKSNARETRVNTTRVHIHRLKPYGSSIFLILERSNKDLPSIKWMRARLNGALKLDSYSTRISRVRSSYTYKYGKFSDNTKNASVIHTMRVGFDSHFDAHSNPD